MKKDYAIEVRVCGSAKDVERLVRYMEHWLVETIKDELPRIICGGPPFATEEVSP